MTKFQAGVLILGVHLLFILMEGLCGKNDHYIETKNRVRLGASQIQALINEE